MKTDMIEQGNYVGYLWKSDAATPSLLTGDPFEESLDVTCNPFIIEGQLFDAVNQVSYSIRYADGKYIINCWNLKTDMQDEDYTFTELEAPAHRMGSVKLCFRQYWKAEKDELCADMKVLKPNALVFVGFKDVKEDKQ